MNNPFIFAVEVVLSGCNMKPFHVMYVYCIPSWTRLSCKTAVADQIYSKPFWNRIWISRFISKILIYSKLKIPIIYRKIKTIINIETSKKSQILHCDQAEFCHSFISRGSHMVFCYQNCSDLLWEKKNSSDPEKLLKSEAEGREFAKFLRSLEQFILTVKGQRKFW